MNEDQYQPIPREFYGVVHTPLVVTPVVNQRRPGGVVAFIGKQICFFERNGPQPQVGKPVEVMISRPLYKWVETDDPEKKHRHVLTAVLLRPVDPDLHILVAIDGFECSGSMCRTTARGVITDGRRQIPIAEFYGTDDKSGRSMWLTPGRSDIREASNVNAGRTWKQPYKPAIPTNVYVERSILEEKRGCGVRVAGLTRPEDCRYAYMFRR